MWFHVNWCTLHALGPIFEFSFVGIRIHWKRHRRLCVNQSNSKNSRYNETKPHNAHNFPFWREKNRKKMKDVAKRNIFFIAMTKNELESELFEAEPCLLMAPLDEVIEQYYSVNSPCKRKRYYTLTVTGWNAPYPSTPVPNLEFSRVYGSASNE